MIEETSGPARERSSGIISNVAASSILDDDFGTVHLYMSAPETAALNNHTDVTDIAVLQLDGAKEWLLCTE